MEEVAKQQQKRANVQRLPRYSLLRNSKKNFRKLQ